MNSTKITTEKYIELIQHIKKSKRNKKNNISSLEDLTYSPIQIKMLTRSKK